MRTFVLEAKEVADGQWELQWQGSGGKLIPPEIYWLLSVTAQTVLDNSRTKGGPPGELLLPSVN